MRELSIEERAYFLWEEAGRPEGRAQEFWSQAETEARRSTIFIVEKEPFEIEFFNYDPPKPPDIVFIESIVEREPLPVREVIEPTPVRRAAKRSGKGFVDRVKELFS
jgi:hypothetical protein